MKAWVVTLALAAGTAYAAPPSPSETSDAWNRYLELQDAKPGSAEAKALLEFACAGFKQLPPGCHSSLMLAKCDREHDRYRSARAKLVEAGKSVGDDECREDAAETNQKLEAKLSSVTFKVMPDRPELLLTLDGEPVPSEKWAEPRQIDPGTHWVELTVGGASLKRKLVISREQGGQQLVSFQVGLLRITKVDPRVLVDDVPVALDGERMVAVRVGMRAVSVDGQISDIDVRPSRIHNVGGDGNRPPAQEPSGAKKVDPLQRAHLQLLFPGVPQDAQMQVVLTPEANDWRYEYRNWHDRVKVSQGVYTVTATLGSFLTEHRLEVRGDVDEQIPMSAALISSDVTPNALRVDGVETEVPRAWPLRVQLLPGKHSLFVGTPEENIERTFETKVGEHRGLLIERRTIESNGKTALLIVGALGLAVGVIMTIVWGIAEGVRAGSQALRCASPGVCNADHNQLNIDVNRLVPWLYGTAATAAGLGLPTLIVGIAIPAPQVLEVSLKN